MSSPDARRIVLLAEDEPEIRRSTIATLEHEGMTVLVAANGREALGASRNLDQPIDLLIAEIRLGGGMSGLELAERLVLEQPCLSVLLLSGAPDPAAATAQKKFPYLASPSPGQPSSTTRAAP